MANALRAPGEFQSVDIVYRRPIYRAGKLVEAGRVTVICNGVVMQDSAPVLSENYHQVGWKPGAFPDKGPLQFQDHGDKVRFRNVWYRPLAPRPSTAAPMASSPPRPPPPSVPRSPPISAPTPPSSRAPRTCSASPRLSPTRKTPPPPPRSIRSPPPTSPRSKPFSGAALEAKKDEAQSVRRAFTYLGKFAIVPATYAPRVALDQIAKANAWDPAKK